MATNKGTSDTGGNNATEYLLSELLEVVKGKIADDGAQINWDPITFAFTVPVGVFGILATLFALVTIIQGILTASPGRRKCSRHAIGKWAKTRKTTFNWDELRTMTFVKTPILRADPLCQALQLHQTGSNMKSKRDMFSEDRILMYKFALYTIIHYIIRYTYFWEPTGSLRDQIQHDWQRMQAEKMEETVKKANWVTLLDHFGLNQIQFEDEDFEITATDHIPDELRAVYTYTDVRTMIALGAVAKAMSFEPEAGSNYPILIGAEIQIGFRQHPVLGTVAAFSKYGTQKDQRSQLGREMAARMFPLGLLMVDKIRKRTTGSRDPNPISPVRRRVLFALKHSNAEVEYIAPKPPGLDRDLDPIPPLESSPHNVQSGPMEFIGAIDDGRIERKPKLPYTDQQIIHGTQDHERFCDSNKNTMCDCRENWSRPNGHNLFWMFVAQVPSEAPAVFPSSCLAIRKSLTTLCLQSRFWSGARAHQSIKRLYSTSDERVDWPWPLMDEFRRSVSNVNNSPDQDIVLQICLQFLHSRNESLSRNRRINYMAIKDLLEGLDSMLDTVPESVLGCRRANLFLTTLILREVSCAIADGSFKASKEDPGAPISLQKVDSANGTMVEEHLNDLKQLELYLSKGIRRCRDEMPGNFFIMTFEVPNQQEVGSDDSPATDSSHGFQAGSSHGSEPDGGHGSNANVIFKRLQDVTAQCAGVANGFQNPPQPNDPGPQRSAFEVVDDMIIWRTILIGVLFSSAPDNSKMYQSAVWNHVIPLL